MQSALNRTDEQPATVELYTVHGEQVLDAWDMMRGPIEAAMETDGSYEAEHVLEDILNERALGWVAVVNEEVQAVAVTRIVHHPCQSVLEVVALGGVEFWSYADELNKHLDAYRESNALDVLRAYCRPGMARHLRRLGWKVKQEVMEYGR